MSTNKTSQFIIDMVSKNDKLNLPTDPVRYDHRFDYVEDVVSDIVYLELLCTSTVRVPLDRIEYIKVGEKLKDYLGSIKSPIRLKNHLYVLLATKDLLETIDEITATDIKIHLLAEYNVSIGSNTIISHLVQLHNKGWVNVRLGYRVGKYGLFHVIEELDIHNIFKI